jgi:hypothetical protein
MQTDSIRQQVFFQRGLVLGMTLAEILTLLVFLVLLLISAAVSSKQKAIDGFKKDIKRYTAEADEKNRKTTFWQDKIKFHLGTDMDIDQALDFLFQGYQFSQDQRLIIAGLKDEVTALEGSYGRLKGVEAVLGEFGFSLNDLDTFKEKFSIYQETFDSTGQGTEMPACWVDPANGKPEYIFNVGLTSKGFIIESRIYEHRKKEQSALPISGITLNKEISPKQFLRECLPLYEWSRSQGCRFFVNAHDLTNPNEKDIYKKRMRVLEQRFYKYESRNEPFPLHELVKK